MIQRSLTRRCLLASLPAAMLASTAPLLAQNQLPRRQGSPLLYYSDYFSFVGSDERGYVMLAHDNNRGQDGDSFQADHWIVMYDQHDGWIDVVGSEHYENSSKLLERIPPSKHFVFEGTPQTGISMVSRSNDMEMTVASLPQTLRRENKDGIFWVGGAGAVMHWRGRTLRGRVIFEYLQRHDWNRFTGTFEANWKNFNGLYLLVDRDRDFYVHSHERDWGSDLTGKLVGMASWGNPAPISSIGFRIAESEAVPEKRFRWPARWDVSFHYDGKDYRLDLHTINRKYVTDWDTGGFAMSIVRGTIETSDRTISYPVLGWGELLI